MTGLSPVVLLYSAGAIYKPARHKESLYFMAFQMFNERILNPKKRKKEKKRHNWNIPVWNKIYFLSILNTKKDCKQNLASNES
jgi:hypothetical protein